MAFKLPTDCLNEIFEHLEEDKITLHSCLLVDRLWCKISVRILWRNIWRYKYTIAYQYQLKVASAILSTLIACLPNESKEILYKNKIFISTPTPNSPLFNYAGFCKVLSINEIRRIINNVLQFFDIDQKAITSKEVIKMFINQISSLKRLIYYTFYNTIPNNISFPYFPNYLVDLLELRCSSNINSEFFYYLSQICHNLQSITIEFRDFTVSNELKELISSQRNLKNLNLFIYEENDWTNIIPALIKHSNTLTKLHLYGNNDSLSLSFVSLFSNLQEFKFSFLFTNENFKELQHVIFPKLQILKIPYYCLKPEYVIKFLENNGKNLKECYFGEDSSALNLSIAEFCPNLKKLSVCFNNDELNTLITIFNNCQNLESIEIWFGKGCLSEKEVLETIVKYSPKKFCELKIYNGSPSELILEDLEIFFLNWKNRTPKISISLIIIKSHYESLEANKVLIIEEYKNLGIIKKFEIRKMDNEEEEEEDDYF
ncbi:hypothetical protein C1645_879991 [Glomus cerebriforme]|uniref:F-box domain-containing protein n=1 Tax=Glomus cerebriforme TaxID=658196 RepID=A0A397SNA0_9GLOM|nr:hypothetical protein C1645_879991 [Glomus cerebriforme]